MLNLSDVVTCKRVMNYKGLDLEYTTGLSGEVYLNAQHCLNIVQSENQFGYVQDMDDFVYLLKKFDCLSKSISRYDNQVIADYLFYSNIEINTMVKLSGKAKCEHLNKFLKEAKETIAKIGFYVPEPEMKHEDRRKNQDRNLSSTLDLAALAEGAYRQGVYEENLYLDVANMISNIVFEADIETVRLNYGLYYEDFLSDSITDYEYDMVAYCCKVVSYLLRYSDIGLYGLDVFVSGALQAAMESYSRPANRGKKVLAKTENDAIAGIFDKAGYNMSFNDASEYQDDNRRLRKKTRLSQEEIDEFKRYM